MLDTAHQLKEVCNDIPFIYRAGVWKPRTSPDTFQGIGEEALGWLGEVKERFDLPVATEVATPEHVRAALFAGIDYLWIGARTSANPIAVQAIADTICKTKRKPQGVVVKNPVSEDVSLWLGNIERLEKTGVAVIAVHRGCNHRPCWHMAHAVRTARPEIPLLIDPSHMSGDAAKIQGLLHKADGLGYDGAMIEVHRNPKEALSDSSQQISSYQLGNYLGSLPCRFRVVSVSFPCRFRTEQQSGQSLSAQKCDEQQSESSELDWLRAEIDELDDRLWETIAARMGVSRRIGEWKKAHGVAALQPKRYLQILSAREQWAAENGLSDNFAKQLFDLIHEESLKKQ